MGSATVTPVAVQEFQIEKKEQEKIVKLVTALSCWDNGSHMG